MAAATLTAARPRLGARASLPVLLAGLVVADLAISVVSLSVSGAHLPLGAAVAAAFGAHNAYSTVVMQSVLPRVLLCWLVGAALGVSGGVIQGVIRNPLASPDVIGISKGAAVGASLIILVFPAASANLIPLGAFAGGILAFFVLYFLAHKKGVTPVRLALTGVAVAAVGDALIRFLLIRWPANINQALVWMVGSLYGRGPSTVVDILPWVAVLLPAVLYFARRLDVLGLGDDLARGLGERVELTRFVTLLLAVVLASAAASVAGAIGFVGLIAPHIARRLAGGKNLRCLPLAALIGTTLMLVADTLGRGIDPPLDIPAGLITAFIGGPYFLYLLVKAVR
jgi:ferric citrate transport system permease protein